MLDQTAAQSLIARITGIGLASAVFTYYLVKLLVKPFIDVRLETNPYREFATNVATAISSSAVPNPSSAHHTTPPKISPTGNIFAPCFLGQAQKVTFIMQKTG